MLNPVSFEQYNHDRFQREKVLNPGSFERYRHDRFQGKKERNSLTLYLLNGIIMTGFKGRKCLTQCL